MQAFHNDPAVKAKYLARVQAHAAADKLIQGAGWDGFKGCAVGCTLEAYDHSRYPIELGLPAWLARLEDSIFEGLPTELAMTWPERFLQAIPVGAELEVVRHRLAVVRLDRLIALQTDALAANTGDVLNAITQVITVLEVVKRCHVGEITGEHCSVSFESAESAAWSAWSAARSAESAARSAAESAESAARSARSAWSAAWVVESETLLKLLTEA